MNYLRQHGELFLFSVIIVTVALFGIAQLLPSMSLPQKIVMAVALIFWIVAFSYCLFRSEFPLFRKYKGEIGLTVLVAYVIVLGLATASEIFELGWFDWL